LVDWLRGLGADASFDSRERLFAERFPNEPFEGSAAQNVALWKALKAEAAAGTFPSRSDAGAAGAAAGASGSRPAAGTTSAPARRPPVNVVVREWVPAVDGERWRVRVDPANQVV